MTLTLIPVPVVHSERFVMVRAWTPHSLHSHWDIEDTTTGKTLATRVRYEAARMIVAALNHAV